jgi:hypothetical protein
MTIKGRKYARIYASPVKLVFGGLLWFTFSSWSVLGAGGHGLIAAPIPNILAIPIWHFYSDIKGWFNYPYTALFKDAYWVFPFFHFSTFYTSYMVFRPDVNEDA